MRQIWITKVGPPEVLELKEAPDPEPKAGEVRIRVEASGVNFADIMGRLGIYPTCPLSRLCLVMRSAATLMLLVRASHRIGPAVTF